MMIIVIMTQFASVLFMLMSLFTLFRLIIYYNEKEDIFADFVLPYQYTNLGGTIYLQQNGTLIITNTSTIQTNFNFS